MSKKKGKSRKENNQEKYNEKIIINTSFEELVKMSLGIKPHPKKEDKEKGSE